MAADYTDPARDWTVNGRSLWRAIEVLGLFGDGTSPAEAARVLLQEAGAVPAPQAAQTRSGELAGTAQPDGIRVTAASLAVALDGFVTRVRQGPRRADHTGMITDPEGFARALMYELSKQEPGDQARLKVDEDGAPVCTCEDDDPDSGCEVHGVKTTTFAAEGDAFAAVAAILQPLTLAAAERVIAHAAEMLGGEAQFE